MDITSTIVDCLTLLTMVGGGIWYFAKGDSKKNELESAQETLKHLIKENHEAVNKRIEVIALEASNTRTDVELIKLRVSMLERDSQKN